MEANAYVAVLDVHGHRLAATAKEALRAAIPSCPAWTMADLVWHVGVVHSFWTALVSGAIDGPSDFPPPDRPADGDLVTWYRDGLAATVVTLDNADPAAAVWTWANDHTVGFVQRRMAHETVMHAWDAAAALQQATPIETVVAVDGVDELFDAFLPRLAVIDGFEDGMHLHSTDTGEGVGEWLLRTDSGRWVVEHRHAKGAFAARGPASDLLLALWGRVPVTELQTFGDPAMFDRFTEAVATGMGGPGR